jgi:hypothetical protein
MQTVDTLEWLLSKHNAKSKWLRSDGCLQIYKSKSDVEDNINSNLPMSAVVIRDTFFLFAKEKSL